MSIPKIKDLFDLSNTAAAEIFDGAEYPWEVLPKIKDFILSYGATLSLDEYDKLGEDIWVHKTATVAPSAFIGGPCIVMENASLRHCAFVRGSAFVGRGATVGNSCELKNVILFDKAEVPHFNYVGDSVLGYKAHMGAGAITSNIKSDRKNIVIRSNTEKIETGMRKIGAILGDNVEVGCNTVLCPGSVVGKNTTVYPLCRVRGVIPENSVCKGEITVEKY